ncbi:MAG TPA: ATP-binding protein [Vicinamibacterales bacterium]|nr:ATP-binding protein [Vicinamibacterales bacterium]
MGLLSRRSIRTKAPLAAVVLILLVVATLSTAAFVVLRRTLHEHAAERLRTLSEQFGQSFMTNLAASRARITAVSKRPEVIGFLDRPRSPAAPAATAALAPTGPQPEQTLRTELRDRDGRRLLEASASPEAERILAAGYDSDWPALAAAASDSDSGTAFGKLKQSSDVIFFPSAAVVPGHPDSYVVIWRRLESNTQSRAQLAKILGSEASFSFGNVDATAWSESGTPVQAPPAGAPGQVFEFRQAGGQSRLGIQGPIDGTPWAYSLSFPSHVVEAPARSFMWTMSSIAAGSVVVGGFLAWLVSRRFVMPVEELTGAADAIARGEIGSRVAIRREDELGRLAGAFNAMASEVETTRKLLEAAVEKGTGELKNAQESLARRERLAIIGHLASSVGHEIRNPLGVMANAVFYLESIQPDAPPEVRQYLGILRRQIALSTKIVNDLLDLSRTSPTHRQDVSVGHLLSEQLQKHGSRVTVEADIPHDIPRVAVDPVHAGQVLDNLLSNAIQAINGQPGIVRIRARATGDGYVRVEVSDTGPGIPLEHTSKIFEPLFTTKARGIGLGLALSRSLAQANGGDVALVSAPDESATFAFILPVAGGHV